MAFAKHLRYRALAALLAGATLAAAAVAQEWPSLHVRGFALRPCMLNHVQGDCTQGDVVDTSRANYFNRDHYAFLLWDRDTLAEQQPAFGGYNVYRAIGPDTANMELLRRYVLRPASKFGNGVVNGDNGSTSRLWTWRDDRLPAVGLFVDPDSIIHFLRYPQFSHYIKDIAIYDTIWVRDSTTLMPGPKNGFDYYYSVTYCDTTEDGEDLTPRSANMVGPVRPTGAPVKNDLDLVKVVPNPYSFRSDWDLPGKRKIRFTNLPAQVTIDIYSLTGDLVRTLSHLSSIDNGEDWDVKNGQGQEVTSGIYVFRLETLDGRSRIGRFTIIR